MSEPKKLYFILMLLPILSISQGNWVWMSGPTVVPTSHLPSYGALGIPSITNTPGYRMSPLYWTDTSGVFWLYGGRTTNYDAGDLFKYNSVTAEWSWMHGAGGGAEFPVYGTMGVGSVSNTPGSRKYSNTWLDNNGDLWLFGGYSFFVPTRPDIWKYNISTDQWTWVKGTATQTIGVYGTQGVASLVNTPGARAGSVTWKDGNGDIWLFGGEGLGNTSNFGLLDDMWKYSPATNQWTWMKGSTQPGQTAVYGSLNVANQANTPGGRKFAHSWISNTGELYLFGGQSNNDVYNDFWKFNPATQQWTWLGGSQTAFSSGVFGTQNVYSTTNIPPAITGGLTWTDAQGNFWLYGGEYYNFNTNQSVSYGDLWKYDVLIGNWVWVKGPGVIGPAPSYGSLGVASPNNSPGARTMSACWKSKNDDLWFYGVHFVNGVSLFNKPGNVWRYSSCSAGVVPVNNTPTSNLNVCSGQSASLTAQAGSSTINWYSTQTSTNSIASGTFVSQPLNAAGGASVYTWYAANGCSPTTTRTAISVTVVPAYTLTAVASSTYICPGDSVQVSVTGGNTYTWSTGQSGSTITVKPAGTLSISASSTSSNGCVSKAAVTISVGCVGVQERISDVLYIYPNPASEHIYVGLKLHHNYNITLLDVAGRLASKFEVNSESDQVKLDVSTLPSGLYFLKIQGLEAQTVRKIVIQK